MLHSRQGCEENTAAGLGAGQPKQRLGRRRFPTREVVLRASVAILQADWASGCEGITVSGREGARESQSGCEEITVKIAPVVPIA
jgi:hypothetical protein